MTMQFPPSEFDPWAESYDQDVVSDTGFPFDGYSRVLQTIVDLTDVKEGSAVLDLGAGTGNIALHFARRNCELWCLDFSGKMLDAARLKLPEAHFAEVDIRAEWPQDFCRRYDAIVSGYTFHHFPLDEKVALIERLFNDHMNPGGCLVVGDLAFHHAADENALRLKMGEHWDQEYFWLADEAIDAITARGFKASFIKISSCAGVFKFSAE